MHIRNFVLQFDFVLQMDREFVHVEMDSKCHPQIPTSAKILMNALPIKVIVRRNVKTYLDHLSVPVIKVFMDTIVKMLTNVWSTMVAANTFAITPSEVSLAHANPDMKLQPMHQHTVPIKMNVIWRTEAARILV